jgi:pseudouridine-5'-phosphate glycosidase
MLRVPNRSFSCRGVSSVEVAAALAVGKAVVALESTIVAHGLPWPQNFEAAVAVEEAVRSHGAVPATVAVVKGRPTVGLSRPELETLSREGPQVLKCSTRELPLAVARRINGATTVASTSLLAVGAGVEVFVTGGAGGVHRDGHNSMDVSPDLVQLARCPLVVVCAGVKSILDIPRTLEFLETQGVCVAAYRTDEFPAFFTPHSGCASPARLDSPSEVAAHFHAARSLGLASATLLAVPNPRPADAATVEKAIKQALAVAAARTLEGAKVTPFVLDFVANATDGKSVEANISLVLNNAKVGAEIAVEMSKMKTMKGVRDGGRG